MPSAEEFVGRVFAALQVRPAHRDYWRSEPRPEQWLLVEWPQEESEPTKYWLSTLPASTKIPDLALFVDRPFL